MSDQEVVDKLVQATEEYTNYYCKEFKTTIIDKQLWGALHLGFAAALKINGYSEERLDGILDKAQKKLIEKHGL